MELPNFIRHVDHGLGIPRAHGDRPSGQKPAVFHVVTVVSWKTKRKEKKVF